MNKRQKQVIQHQLTMENIVLKELEQEYKEALKDINLKIQMFQSMPETQSRIYHRQYQETLKKQIEAALEKLHSDEYTTINQYLHDTYTDAFVGTMYDLHGQGTPVIAPIDQNAAIKAVMTDTRLNKPLYTKLGIDVNKLKRTVSSEISRGIAAGLAYAEIARNIQFRTNAPIGRAKTIVRTEGHRIQQASAEDARQVAKSKGADVVKMWDSLMDGRTRPTHRRLDGQIREVDEPFELGKLTAMYPGDFGDPAEDCNCRCVALTRSRSALDEEELKVLQDRAKFFGLDKTESFNDFKKKYVKADSDVKKDQEYQKQIRERVAAYKTARSTASKIELPDFGKMSLPELIEYQSKHLKTTFEGVKGANRDFVAEATKAIAQFEQKMGGRTIDGLSVKFGGTTGGVYAKYDDKTNTILLKKTGSLQAFVESQENENTRYHIKWKTTKDYHATTSYSGTVFHELGHAVDIDTNQALSKALSVNEELFEKSVEISVYAGSSQNIRVTPRSEAWAENFAAYMDGGSNAKKVPEAITLMIEDYYANAKKLGAKAVQTVENTGKSGIIKMGNADVRKWYIDSVSRIPDEIDKSLSILEKAQKAFEARNRIRTEARKMMADEETRKRLDQEHPNKTFEELVKTRPLKNLSSLRWNGRA